MPVAKITFITGIEADAGKGVADSLDPGISRTVSGTFLGTLGPDEALQISVNGGTTWIDANTTAGAWTASGVVLEPGSGSLLARTVDGQGHSLDVISAATLPDVVAISPADGTASTGSSANWQQQLFSDFQDPEGNETRNATASSAAAQGVLAEETSGSVRLGETQPGHDAANTAELGVAELAAAKTQPSSELLFIDGSISGYEQLIAGARAGVEVIVLDSTRDGFAQITAALAGRDDIATIHLVTHGDPGRVALGNTAMTVQSLDEHAAEVASWSAALSPGADILIYGCDVGQGLQGTTLLDKLSSLTGADSAASSNLTGSGPLGSDWKLEVSHGAITSQLFAQPEALAAFHSVLAKPVIDLNGATVISVGDDFATGTYTGTPATLNNLPRTWTSGWLEFDASPSRLFTGSGINSDNSPIGGNVVIASVASAANGTVGSLQELAIVGDGNAYKDTIERTVNLKSYTSGTLSFKYRTLNLTAGTDVVQVDISDNGGANFTMLGTLANAAANTTATFNISSYLSENTTIRFALRSGFNANNKVVYFDDVSITADGNNFVTNFSEPTTGQPVTAVKLLQTGANPAIITDPDAGQLLRSATVQLNNFKPSDTFYVDTPNLPAGITLQTLDNNAGTVVLASAAGASAANFITALGTITFANALRTPDTTLRSISITVTDVANETSLPSTAFVRMVPFDDPVTAVAHGTLVSPIATSLLGTTTGRLFDNTNLGTERTPNNPAMDFDLDTVDLSTALLSGSQHSGTVVVNANGTYSYTPATNYTGPDQFSYTLTSKAQVIGTNYEFWDLNSPVTNLSSLKTQFPVSAPYKANFIVGFNVDGAALDTVSGTKTATTGLNNFVVRFTNTLTITTGGTYIFTAGADDSALVKVDINGNGVFTDTGELVVDNDGVHPYGVVTGPAVTLNPGTYTVQVDFYEQGGQEDLRVWYTGPDTGGLVTDLSDVGQVLANSTTTRTVYLNVQNSGPRLALGGNENAQDNFSTGDYTGNQGTFPFPGAWTESNDDNSATLVTGGILVTGGALQVSDTSGATTRSITREINLLALSGNSPTRVGYRLSFDYSSPGASDGVQVQISTTGVNGPYTTLDTIISSSGVTPTTSKTYDISRYASSNVVLQFLPTAATGINPINFDNIRFDASTANNSGLTYQENAAGTAIASSGTAIGVPSATNITGATVTIANYVAGQDTLSFTPQSGISVLSNANGVLTLTGTASAANYATALQSVLYANSSDAPTVGNRTINVAVTDATGLFSNTAVATVAVSGVNDAPLGVNASVTTALNTPYILRTADFVFTDVENNALNAVKFTTAPASTGTLQWNSGGLGTWTNVAANDTISASDINLGRVRLLPAIGVPGNATFTFQVQDNGGTAAGGVDTDTVANNFTVRVLSGTNAAPMLAGSGTLTLTSSPEDSAAPTAKTISQLLTDSGPGTTFSDPDAGAAMSGLAIVGNTANAGTQGKWQYSLNGTTWTDVGTVGNTGATALALSASTQMRFLSVANYNGTPPALSVRVLDDTYMGSFSSSASSVYVGATPFASTAISNSGALYSLGTTVTPVNDAPTLTAGGPALTAVTAAQANDPLNTGRLVSSFVNSGTNPTTVADIDASPVNGIAIFGANGSAGTWEYSIDGVTWTSVGSVSTTSALLLRSTDRIRYNPDGTGAGSGGLNYKAWDQTAGSAGTKVDATVTGGSTAFSNAVDAASISVTSVTTIPSLSVSSSPTFSEDGTAAAINASLVVAADGGNNNLTGATITMSNFVAGQDTLSFSNQLGISVVSNVNGVLTLTGTTSAANYQTALRSITFTNSSDAPDTTPRAVTFRVTDATGPSNVLSGTVNISAVNDAPVVAGSASAPVYAKNTAAIQIDPTITVSDADSPDNFNAGFLQVTLASAISLEDRLSVLATGGIVRSGSNITYNGTLIGTVAASGSGINGEALKIDLNLNSTPAAVQALARAISYDNLELSNPSVSTLSPRAVTFLLNDGGNVGSGVALSGSKATDTITVSNISPPVISSVTDDTGSTRIVANGGLTDDTTLLLTGTALASATVSIYKNGVFLVNTPADTNGAWSYTTTAPQTPTGATYVFSATQTSSGTSGPSSNYAVTVDTAAPAAPVITAVTDNVGTIQGTVANNGQTDDTVLVLTGTAEANSTVTIFNGVTQLGTATTDAGGAWTFTTGTLTDATYNFNAKATDVAGNQGAATANYVVTVDTVAPTNTTTLNTTFTDSAGTSNTDRITTDNTITLSGTASAGTRAGVNLYDGATFLGFFADAGGGWGNYTTAALADGVHTFTARVVDTAGNEGPVSPTTTAITIDRVANVPVITSIVDNAGPITGNIASGGSTDDTTLVITGTAEPNSSVRVRQLNTTLATVTADANGDWTYTTTAAQTQVSGTAYPFHARQTDVAGNVSLESPDYLVTVVTPVDTVGPTVTVTDNLPGTANIATGTIAYTYTFNESVTGLATNDFTITNGTITGVTGSGTTWTVNVTKAANVPSGNIELVMRASAVTDAAGNPNAQDTNFAQAIDTVAPTVTVTDNVAGTVNQSTGSIAYTYTFSEPVTGLTSSDFGTPTNGTISSVSGSGTTWTVNVTPANLVGSGNISLTLAASAVTDAAGNPNAVNTNTAQLIDTLAPAATPTITTVTDDVGTVTGNVANAGTTDDALLVIAGTATANALVNVYDGVTLLGQVTASAGGAWTFPTPTLANGAHSFTASEADAAGNVGPATAARTATLDNTPPTVIVTDNLPGTAIISTPTSIAYTYTFSETVTGLDSNDFTVTNGTISSITPVSGTVYTVNVTPTAGVQGPANITLVLAAGAVNDLAGTPNAVDTNSAQPIDTLVNAPTVTLTNDTGTFNSDLITRIATLSVTGTEAGATVEYSSSGSGPWSGTPPTPATGSNPVFVRQTDTAGNVSAPGNLTYTLDTSNPAAPVITGVTEDGTSGQVEVNNRSTFDTRPTLYGANLSAEANSIISVYSGTTLLGTTTADANGAWSFTPPAEAPLRSGLNQFSVSSADTAGNSTGSSGTFDLIVNIGLATSTNLTTNGLRIPGEFLGTSGGDASGFAMRGVGDINGDGFADMIIGAPYNRANTSTTPGNSFVLDSYGRAIGIGRSYVVFGQAAAFPLVVPLNNGANGINGSNGFRITGAAAGDASGWAVSDVGDVNGDGFADLIIGAIYANAAGGSVSGAAYVVFGKSSFPFPSVLDSNANMSLSSLDGSNGFRISGAAADDEAGITVNPAGDLNGDGFEDIIVGAPYATRNSNEFTGAGYVVFGKASGFAADVALSALNGTTGFSITGTQVRSTAGIRMDGIGDINGDGYKDLIISANRYDSNTKTDNGAAYVIFGKSSFASLLDINANIALSSITGSTGFRITGTTAGDELGWGISDAGDVNGDGFADFIIGTPNATVGGTVKGAAYVVFGKASFTSMLDGNSSFDVAILDGSNGFRIAGGATGDRAGFSVCTAGDFNGDGYSDLLIGAPGAASSTAIPGQSYIVFGKATFSTGSINLANLGVNNSDGFKISGIATRDDLGYQVSAVGDLNGDGFDDIAVSSSRASPTTWSNGTGTGAGETYVIFGTTLLVAGQTLIGTAGNDQAPLLTGSLSAIAEKFVGGQGDDVMTGNGGNDAFSGGSGNDTIILGVAGSPAIPFVKVNGGTGFDTLALAGSGVNLNLTTLGDKIQGIERIDLTGNGNNTVVLNVRDVLNVSDSTNRLLINGDAGDTVSSIDQGWARSSSGQVTDHGIVYDSYTLGGMAYSKGIPNLLVEPALTIILA